MSSSQFPFNPRSLPLHLKWKKDKTFAAAHEEALTVAVDLMECEARRRGVEGKLGPVYDAGKAVGAIRRFRDTILIFMLKAARPEKYRDSYNSFGEPLKVDRERVINSLHKKLAAVIASRITR